MDLEQFAAARSRRLTNFEGEIRGIVEQGLANYANPNWFDEIVVGASVLWLEVFETYWDGDSQYALERFQNELRESLAKTSEPDNPPTDGQVDRVLRWLGVFSVNNATYYAAAPSGGIDKTWVDMEDSAVRPTHRETSGQTVRVGGTFDVGGFQLRFPGEPVGPPEIWINCRCLLAVTGGPSMSSKSNKSHTFSGHMPEEKDMPDEDMMGDDMEDDIDEDADMEEMRTPWHGVLVVEGVPTGDRRQFDPGSLSYAEFPLPLAFQRMSADGHMQSVVVGRIDEIWVEGSQHRARGYFNLNVPEANEAIDGIMFGSLGGVSVDVDSAKFELDYTETDEDDPNGDAMAVLFGGEVELTRFTEGRIRAATLVSIPAFAEAFVALGPDFEDEMRDPETGVGGTDLGEDVADTDNEDELDEELRALLASALAARAEGFAAKPPSGAQTEAKRGLDWVADGKGGDGLEDATIERARKIASGAELTDDHIRRMHSYFARHEVDKKGKGWSQGDEGYPSAGRVAWALWGGDAGKTFADAQWKKMEKAASDSITAGAAFAPGTKDGPGWITNPRPTARLRRYWTKGKGAAKIRWGAPGDFNRCRKQLGKYVNPAFLAGTCANMHKEATGMWPGRQNGRFAEADLGPAFSLVASAALSVVDHEFFENPNLDRPTPLTVEGDRVFGHIAAWGTCHIGIGERCVMPPSSPSKYSHFLRGIVDTDQGPVRTGTLVLGTGHAGSRAAAEAATKHYDNTGRAVADIHVGEDAHGIWFSGMIRETASAADIKVLKASSVSGDWRDVNRIGIPNEMVGLLTVNTNGFAMPRVEFAMDGDRQLSLIASGGILAPRKESDPAPKPRPFSNADDLLAIGRVVADELEYRANRKERLANARDAELAALAEERRVRRLAAARSLEV